MGITIRHENMRRHGGRSFLEPGSSGIHKQLGPGSFPRNREIRRGRGQPLDALSYFLKIFHGVWPSQSKPSASTCVTLVL